MRRRAQIAGKLLIRAAALYALWLLIDDNVSQPELFTGIAVALLALALAIVIQRASSIHARLKPAMLRRAYRLPGLLLGDSIRVCIALLCTLVRGRRTHGRLRAIRYGPCSDAETDVARRALTQWAASIAPNRYVIGIDTEARVLLVHQLVETNGAVDPLELG